MIEFYSVTGNEDLNKVIFADDYGYHFEGTMTECLQFATANDDGAAEFAVVTVSKTNSLEDVEYWGTNGLSTGSPYDYIKQKRIAAFIIKTVIDEKMNMTVCETDFLDKLDYNEIAGKIKVEVEGKYLNKIVDIDEVDADIKNIISRYLQNYSDAIEDEWDEEDGIMTINNIIKFDPAIVTGEEMNTLDSYPMLVTKYEVESDGTGKIVSVGIN